MSATMDEDLITPIASIAPSAPQEQLPLQSFYNAELLEVPAAAKKLLTTYSKIPEDEVLPHILQVRDRAWKTYPFPCIGHYRFLDFAISRSRAYPEILSRLRKGEQQFLDVGCCLGQELRQLVAEGVKSENLYGIDIRTDFFDIGYDLFRDRDSLNSLFLTTDLFDLSEGSLLEQLRGKIDIIWCSAVLHLFSWKAQVAALVKMLQLLKRAPATMLAGRLMGSSTPGEYSKAGVPAGSGSEEATTYRHDKKTFKKMFHEACDVIGEKWETDLVAKEWKETLNIKTDGKTAQKGLLEIWFVAKKLERVDILSSQNVVRTWGAGDDGEYL